MKTKEKIEEADKKERVIRRESAKQRELAQLEYDKATKEEAELFAQVRDPALARWQKFSEPYFKELIGRLSVICQVEEDALGEIRKDWGNCPRCQTLYGRFQVFCSNEKCRTNFLLIALE